MKYLLVLVLALGMLWLWRHNRQAARKDAEAAEASKATERPARHRQQPAVEIVECAVCGLHLPQSDAVTDARGSYCCDAHRRQHGA
jgi:uncharacterized protein